MAKEKMKTSSVQLPTRMWDYIVEIAENENISVSAVVREIIMRDIRTTVIAEINKLSSEILKFLGDVAIKEVKMYLIEIEGIKQCRNFNNLELFELFVNNEELFEKTVSYLKLRAAKETDISLLSWIKKGDNE